jgi:hypothetical protein
MAGRRVMSADCAVEFDEGGTQVMFTRDGHDTRLSMVLDGAHVRFETRNGITHLTFDDALCDVIGRWAADPSMGVAVAAAAQTCAGSFLAGLGAVPSPASALWTDPLGALQAAMRGVVEQTRADPGHVTDVRGVGDRLVARVSARLTTLPTCMICKGPVDEAPEPVRVDPS